MSYIFLNYLITYVSQNVLERTFVVFHVFCEITVKMAISDDSQFINFQLLFVAAKLYYRKKIVLERTFFSDKAMSGFWKPSNLL